MRDNICPFNESNQPHGYWKLFYPNGNIWYEGLYVNGKEQGLWVFIWDEEGKNIDIDYYI